MRYYVPNDCYRDGATVLIRDGGTLPDRCVKCNAPAAGNPIKFTFVDSDVDGSPHGVIGAAVHFSTRRTATVYVSLCAAHRRLRTMIRIGCPLLAALTLAAGYQAQREGILSRQHFVGVAVALVALGLFPLGIYQQHYLKGRIENRWVLLDGAGEEFLLSIPLAE